MSVTSRGGSSNLLAPDQSGANHPLSPDISRPGGRRSSSFNTHPRPTPGPSRTTVPSGVPGSQLSTTAGRDNYDAVQSGSHERLSRPTSRRHAATISVSAPGYGKGKGRVTEADLLGVSIPARSGSTWHRRGVSDTLEEADELQHEDDQGYRRGRTIPMARSGSGYLDELSKEDAAVLEMRFDLMTDEDLAIYLDTLFPLGKKGQDSKAEGATTPTCTTPRPVGLGMLKPSTDADGDETDDKSPLFPPSPPARPFVPLGAPDHPLRVLSRALKDLREILTEVEEENLALREELKLGRPIKKGKPVDNSSIYDGLTEALSTSLDVLEPTQPSTFPEPSPPLSSSLRPAKSPASSASALEPSPGIRSSASATDIAPSDTASTHGSTSGRRGSASQLSQQHPKGASWTSGLWVWNRKVRRKGSMTSIASTSSGPSHVTMESGEPTIPNLQEETETWRLGDGGSPPSFRAIFLATRILTPDTSSILSTSTPPGSLIASLAHTLVSNARDLGIVAVDPGRRTSKSKNRSRATSVTSTVATETPASRPSGSTADLSKDTLSKGYTDSAKTVGRSLLSTVSSATSRVPKTPDITFRPSLLNRASSSKPFPTTSVSSSNADSKSGADPNSTEYLPPPSVELSSIVPDEARPPTVLLSRQNLGSFFRSNAVGRTKLPTATRFKSDNNEPPLTDRYGFIYDIQHASMLKDASVAGAPAPASLNGTVPAPRGTDSEAEGWIDKRKRENEAKAESEKELRSSNSQQSLDMNRSPSRASHISTQSRESGDAKNVKSVDAISSPSEILSAAGQSSGIKHDRTGSVTRHRSPSSLLPSPAKPVTGRDKLVVSARGSKSLVSNVAGPSSPLSASLSLSDNLEASKHKVARSSSSAGKSSAAVSAASRATVSSLLDQLTEIHDRQQSDRRAEWDSFLRKQARFSTDGKSEETRGGVGMLGIGGQLLKSEDFKTFRRLVRGGIPMAYRSDIWAECSGAKELAVPGEYAEILVRHAGETSAVLGEIEKDVGRTFPGNVFFGGDGPGVAKLRRVLMAYSWHNPAVGYCQGMNMLAATLLLTHTDEEQAFWTLLTMVERLLPPSFFSPDLRASRAFQAVLEDLVRALVPKVWNHLNDLGVDLASITFGWFLSLFTDCLPVETLFRVWDVLFVEGQEVLFRVALAILKLNEPDILAANSVGGLFTFVSGVTSRLWAADKLISLQHSFRPLVKHADVNVKIEKYMKELESSGGVEAGADEAGDA